jgi:hypothetical protein
MTGGRRLAALALVLGVSVVHLWLAGRTLEDQIGSGDAERIRRIDVAFVRALAPTAPAPAAPAAPKPKRRAPPRAAAAEPAASAPAPAASAPAAVVASAPEPVVASADVPAAAASAPEPEASAVVAQAAPPAASAAAPAASAPPPFDWPPSTRISYALNGYWRGPVEGQAQVEWLRRDQRYQVRFEVTIGPSFAPLARRSFVSEGEIGEQGLVPQRYEQVTTQVFGNPKRETIQLDEQTVRLNNGNTVARPPGVQDTASQFVQLTYLFTTQAGLLVPGRTLEMPLALPRSVEPWTYDVIGRETLHTRFGPVETLHVKPRREPRPGVVMTVELWIAPTLQNLPIRSLIRADAETWADLLITQLPQQAAPGR